MSASADPWAVVSSTPSAKAAPDPWAVVSSTPSAQAAPVPSSQAGSIEDRTFPEQHLPDLVDRAQAAGMNLTTDQARSQLQAEGWNGRRQTSFPSGKGPSLTDLAQDVLLEKEEGAEPAAATAPPAPRTGPQIQEEETPAKTPPVVSIYSRAPGPGGGAPRPQDVATYVGPGGRTVSLPKEATPSEEIQKFLLSPPDAVQDLVQEVDRLGKLSAWPGPFHVAQKAVVEPLAGLTSPLGIGLTAATAGVGGMAASSVARVAVAGKMADAALSTYFAGESAKNVVKSVPAAYEDYQRGDLWGALGEMGSAGTSAFLGTLAGLHAKGQISDAAAISATYRALQERLNVGEAARQQAERAARPVPQQITGPGGVPVGQQPPPTTGAAATTEAPAPGAPPLPEERSPAATLDDYLSGRITDLHEEHEPPQSTAAEAAPDPWAVVSETASASQTPAQPVQPVQNLVPPITTGAISPAAPQPPQNQPPQAAAGGLAAPVLPPITNTQITPGAAVQPHIAADSVLHEPTTQVSGPVSSDTTPAGGHDPWEVASTAPVAKATPPRTSEGPARGADQVPASSAGKTELSTAPGQAPAAASTEKKEEETGETGEAQPNKTYDYSSAQTNLPDPLAKRITQFNARIPDSKLAPQKEGGDGRETQPHITLKYGLHTEEAADVEKLLAGEPPITAKLRNTSIFPASETGKADVLKVDVESPDLQRLNAKLAAELPHTDTHPVYQPHVTVAYLKPGEGAQYAGKPVPGVSGQTITLNSVRFSAKNGQQTDIPLGKTLPGPSPSANSTGQTAGPGVAEGPAKAQLPRDLAGAKPRYNYGAKSFELSFANDVDRAAYITAQPKPSSRDADYLKFAMNATGGDEADIRQYGRELREGIKQQAKVTPASAPDAGGVVKPGRLDVQGAAAERGSFSLKPTEPAGPRENYSFLGRARDLTVRNLSQLEKADPESHAAVVRAATAKAQSATIIQEAEPRIEKALGKDGPSFTDFRKALIEGRLRAIRDRYLLTAKGVVRFSDQQMENGLEHNPELTGLLRKIEGQRGIPQDVIETAAGFESQGKLGELRDFLRQTFEDAAANVAHVLPDEDYNRIRASAGYQRALPVYKSTFENRLARIHARNEGVFSTAIGDAYYPLVPVSAAEKLAAKPLGKANPYRVPANVHNEFATGLATYDAGMEAFRNNLARAAGANNKASAIRTLEENGWLRVLDEGERAPATVSVHGIEEKAEVLETNTGKQVERKGKTEYRPSVAAVAPAWLAKELQPVFDKDELPGGWPRKVVDAMNWWSLQGPAMLEWHGLNLIGTVAARVPFLSDSLVGKAGEMLPGGNMVAAIGKLLWTDVTSDEAAARFVRMAEQGTLPPNFRSVTYSKKFADQTGAKLARVSPAPLLYGRKGLDARARLLMDIAYDRMVPEAERKTLDRYKFVNQLGNYTTALEGAMVRAAKRGGLAVFATAGTTMLRNGINAALGTGPVPGNKWSYRLALLLSTKGIVGMALLYTAIHKAYTGKWPWDDRNAKLMQIPLKPSDRNSALGRAICGTKPGTCYVSVAIANPLLVRGLGALGATNAFETHQLGGSPGQMLESGIKGAANAAAHPFVSGAAPRAASVLALGKEPYLTSVHPMSLYPATKRTKPGLPWLGERVKEAALSMNPFFQDVAAGLGLGYKAGEAQKQGNWWLRMAVNLAAPRLGAGVSDQGRRAEMVERAKHRAAE